MSEPFTALVLAGSRAGGDPLARHAGVSHKCLVPIAGKPMLLRVIEALRESPSVGRIVISIEQPEQLGDLLPAVANHVVLPSAPSPSRSVLAALDGGNAAPPMLITTADHPLLRTEMIEHFVAEARASSGDLVAGLVSAETVRAAHPDAVRTFLRFRDGRYSGANLFALMGESGRDAVAFWRRVEAERKRPWRMVRAFGAGPLLAYLLGVSTLETTMARAGRIMGARTAAVVLPFAEAAIDVDKPADLALVERILSVPRQGCRGERERR